MNLTILPKFNNNQKMSFGVKTPKNGTIPPYSVNTEAQKLVGNFANAAANETRKGAYKERSILENLQALLGGIESNASFQPFSAETKMDILRKAITNQIENLKNIK